MLRRLASILTIIILVLLPFIFAPQTFAAWGKIGDQIETPDDLDAAMGASDKNLRDFCAKRQGNQMNLETWYSGKCVDDTFAGDGVGFSDIVILDLQERLQGKKDPNSTFFDTLKGVMKGLESSETSQATPEQQLLAIESARQKLFESQDSGIIGQSGKLFSMVFQNQPASTKSYLAYITHNLQQHKIIPPVLAANGIGFETFSPFLTIWLAARNLAYFGVVIFFIVYGFMMMFRVNLGQKTVISVQLAIPKLIITLLLITFSYAIVGFIYDLMWVLISFIFVYLQSQGIIVSKFFPYLTGGYYATGLFGSAAINSLLAAPTAIFGVLNLVLGGIGAALVGIGATVLGFGWIVMFIVFFAVLISYVKLFFKLVLAFLSVILSLITAPLALLGNAFPGSTSVGTWIRGIVANLSVFPVTMLLLFFSYLLMIQPLLGICQDHLGTFLIKLGVTAPTCEWLYGVKNLVPSGSTGLYGVPLMSPVGFSARGLLALLGVALLLMASKYVDIIKDALKVPPFKYGSDIVSALKSGAKANDKWAAADYDGIGGKYFGEAARSRYGTNTAGQAPTINRTPGGTNIPTSIP